MLLGTTKSPNRSATRETSTSGRGAVKIPTRSPIYNETTDAGLDLWAALRVANSQARETRDMSHVPFVVQTMGWEKT